MPFGSEENSQVSTQPRTELGFSSESEKKSFKK